MEYYSAIKKNKILPFAATWLDLECLTLSEISQTEEDKYSMISHVCGISKIIQMNVHAKQKQTQETNSQLLKGRGMGEGEIGGMGLKIQTM